MLVVRALHTFIAEHGDELNFHAGEDIVVIEKDDAFGDGWWRGRNTKGDEGLFPATYISESPPTPPETSEQTVLPAVASEQAVNGTAAVPIESHLSSNTENSTSSAPESTAGKHLEAPRMIVPAESPKGTTDADGYELDNTADKSGSTVADVAGVAGAVGAAGAAAVGAVGVGIGRTIGDIQDAIESITARPESDDEQELGIGQDARAKLVEHARLANEQRERNDGGFVYSDESEDEDEDFNKSLPLVTKSRASVGTESPLGNGPHDEPVFLVKKEEPAVINEPSSTSMPPVISTPGDISPTVSSKGVGSTQKSTPLPETAAGSLEPAFFPNSPPIAQTATGHVPSSTSNRSSSIPAKPVTSWTVDDVTAWAQAKGFDEGICEKFQEHEITGDILLELDANLLKELDIPAFGKRMRIAAAISELRRPSSMISSSSQQLSPSGLPTGYGNGVSMRGMSAPPSTFGQSFPSTPPMTTPPTSASSEDSSYAAWAHGRKTSSHVAPPPMEAINENGAHAQAQLQPKGQGQPPRSSQPTPSGVSRSTSTRGTSTTAKSTPVSPVTPGSSVSKRESTGSMSHKRGKPSMDTKDRLSFFGRTRKPAPNATSPTTETGSRSVSRLGFGSTNKVHQMQPASPQNPARRPSGAAGGTGVAMSAIAAGAALKQIGTPDHAGYLKKKGERYGGWKARYAVLKGPTLYILKSDTADSLKDKIDLHNHRIMADQNSNPGSYGFRLVSNAPGVVGADKTHFFSSPDQTIVRGWMKALLKATIARDYTKPVTSSCNIPTIPLAEAQALAPRPPSPATREATQKATRRENPNQLTPHDANILMSLDTTSGEKRRSKNLTPSPARPNRDMRRPSSNFSQSTTRPLSSAGGGVAAAAPAVGNGGKGSFSQESSEAPVLLEWVNTHLPPIYPRAASLPQSFVSGEVVFLLVKSLSGVEPEPPVPPTAFKPEADGSPGLEGLFAMMDILVDAGVPTEGFNTNEVREGHEAGVVRLLKSVRDWYEGGMAR